MKLDQENWIFVYSNINDDPENDDLVEDVFKTFIESAKVYGIKINKPLPLVVVKPGVENWIKTIIQ